MKKKKRKRKVGIFISFIEECIMNPDYYDYIGGRIEVGLPGEYFASEEIRFFTKSVEEFYKFREKWDMKEINKGELEEIRRVVKDKFYESERRLK